MNEKVVANSATFYNSVKDALSTPPNSSPNKSPVYIDENDPGLLFKSNNKETDDFGCKKITFIPRIEDYDISPNTGFIPSQPPLKILPQPFDVWDGLIQCMRPLLLSGRFRKAVLNLPVFEEEVCSRGWDVRVERRAYTVVSFLASAYVWGRHATANAKSDDFVDIIPTQLAVPLSVFSYRLGLRPIISYASTCLWNWYPLNANEPLCVTNIAIENLFSGSMDEAWFYIIPLGIELIGAKALGVMNGGWIAARELLNSVDHNQSHQGELAFLDLSIELKNATNHLASILEKITSVIQEMEEVLTDMHQCCDPHVFYSQVRHYLAGWSRLQCGGVAYDSRTCEKWDPVLVTTTACSNKNNVNNTKLKRYAFSGGSAGQSSIIQALDVFLGVSHNATGGEQGGATKDGQGKGGYLTAMREYMPAQHRQFLIDCESYAPSVKDAVNLVPQILAGPYNDALSALKCFRDTHLQVVARYIVSQASKVSEELHGTGGTLIIPFLKKVRDETIKCIIK